MTTPTSIKQASPKSKDSDNKNNIPEEEEEENIRIFIGGLNPPNLTSKHIIQQLRQNFPSTKQKKVTFTIDNEHLNETNLQKPFIHVNVKVSQRKQKQQQTIYYLIRKRFHNIVWKGCQLRIELARPCFLKRLEEERKVRTEEEEKKNDTTSAILTKKNENSSHKKSSAIPRMLKIRDTMNRKPECFRAVVYVNFDSKPRACKEVSECVSTSRLTKPTKKLPKLRSQHFRFAYEDEEDNVSVHSVFSSSESSSSTGSGSSHSCDDSISGEDVMNETKLKSKYVWSSSSSSSSSSDEDEDENSIMDDNLSISSDIIEEKSTETNSIISTTSNPTTTSEDYTTTTTIVNNEKDSDDDSTVDMDLDTDINENIRIFQQLYPDEEVTINQKDNDSVSGSTTTATPTTGKKMQRFDPTSIQSVDQFELKHQIPVIDQDEIKDGDGMHPKHEHVQPIYEQSTLEDIFKTAKDSTTTTTSLFTKQVDNEKEEQAPLFNFFAFGDEKETSNPNTTTDDKSSNVVTSSNTTVVIEQDDTSSLGNTNENDMKLHTSNDENIELLKQQKLNSKRKHVFVPYTTDELKPYLSNFFKIQSNTKTDELDEMWTQERRVLTIDWKRKLKDVIKMDRKRQKNRR